MANIRLQTLDQSDVLYPETKAELVLGLPDYAIATTVPDPGYETAYVLTKNGIALAPKINIPSASGVITRLVNVEVKKCLTDNDPPGKNLKVGDLYADYTLINSNGIESHIYCRLFGQGKGINVDDEFNINLNVNDDKIQMNYNNTGQPGLVKSTASLGTDRNKKVLSGNGDWITGVTYEEV